MANKTCKYGCGQELEWDNAQSMYKEVATQTYHNKDRCEQLKKQRGTATPPAATTATNTNNQVAYSEETTKGGLPGPTNHPSLEAILLNQLSQSVTQLNKNFVDAVESAKVVNKVFYEKIESTFQMVNQNRIMLEAIVAHLKLTEPVTASELLNQKEGEQNKDPIEVNHGKIADDNETKQKQIEALKAQGIVNA